MTVAQGCCKEAALRGYDVTLLLALAPTGHVSDYGGAKLASLGAMPPYADIPRRLIAWLANNPQDILVLNGCEQADQAIPYLPAGMRVIFVAHDTANRYFDAALRFETYLDGIIAVSETVSARFRSHVKDAEKLHVVHNGTSFPAILGHVLKQPRRNDILFLGGDNAVKGALDVIALWPVLAASGFDGRLHWFGAISEATQRRIVLLPRADRIQVHGRKARQEIFDSAVESKIVLMLSRVEPFGMVTIECMGMGCLPVAWDIDTGTKEIVQQSEGIFVPLGDYNALAAGVLRAIDIHHSIFASSTSRIRQDFSETAMWLRYVAAFDSILSAPPAVRKRAGRTPPLYRPPLRLFQLLPSWIRRMIRHAIGQSPRLGYALRDFRGK